MDSSKKIPWNSSTKINGTGTTSGLSSSRDTLYRHHLHYYQRLINEQKIPSIEVTNRLKLLSEAINETSAENIVLGKEVTNLMNTLELEPHLLSREVKDGLDKVTAILKKENLTEVNETALIINMEKRKRKELMTAREDKEFKKKFEELCSHYLNLEEKLQTVQKKVSSLMELIETERIDCDNDYSNVLHNETKYNDYKKTCENLDEELADMNLTDDYADKILDKYKETLQATGELAEINKLIGQYNDLPPDILEAKAFLEQREKRRQELKRMLDEKLN